MLAKYTQIHWGKALLMLLPPLLRKQKQTLWLRSLLKPLEHLYEDTLYKMQHNGQVVYLEKVLNEIFNPTVTYKYNADIQAKLTKGYIVIDESYRPELQYLYTHREIEQVRGEIIVVQKNEELLKDENVIRNYLYLSGAVDFISTQYYNFRVLIPDSLLFEKIEYNEVLACIQDEYENNAFTYLQYKEQIEELNNVLVLEEDTTLEHPNGIKIASPKFHKVLHYYKLAGKSYETQFYKHHYCDIKKEEEN